MDRQYRRKYPAYSRQHKSRPKTGRGRRLLLGVFLLTVVVWGILGLVRSDFFSLQEFSISGHIHASEEEILLALPVGRGDNIWQLNPRYLESRLKQIPRIEQARVSRKLPRTLVVEITEKKPLVLVPFQQYLLEIAADGMILGATQEPQSYGLPLLTGLIPRELTVGSILLEGETLQEARSVILAMEELGVAVSELNMGDENNRIMVTLDGLTVWLGKGKYEQKADILVQIMSQLGGRRSEGYLDLRVLTAPAFHVTEEE
jgi:cell division protein FtsQ